MNNHLKNAGYILASLIFSIIAGTLLLFLVYCIPVDRIRNNVKASVSMYQTDGGGVFLVAE